MSQTEVFRTKKECLWNLFSNEKITKEERREGRDKEKKREIEKKDIDKREKARKENCFGWRICKSS